jgi:hypothetical protein
VGDVEFEDASANNGQDVYDRVMVAWQSPSGQQLRVTRTNATALTLRQGFHRTFQLSVSSALPSDGVAASQIGDVWLANHRSVPFRGTVRIVGDTARYVTSGMPVRCEDLLGMTGELMRFNGIVDPDSGAMGRDGRIAGVSYDPVADEASVTVDSSRSAFDALLARHGALSS